MYSMPQDPAVILVVDEDPLALMGITATLDLVGYECHGAQDAEGALKAARSLNLDLIICDVNVDGGRGLELSYELRREHGNEDVSVLFVSGGAVPEVIRRKDDVGATYYLRKPLDPDVLVELVGKALWMPHLVRARAAHASRTVHPQHATPPAPPAAGAFQRREPSRQREAIGQEE